MKKFAVFAFALVFLAFSTFIGQPAAADDGSRTIQIDQKFVPGILDNQTNLPTVIGESGKTVGRNASVRMLSHSAISDASISFSIDYVAGVLSTANGSTVLGGDDPAVTALAHGTKRGFQVLTTLVSAPKSNKFDYTFNLPNTATMIETPMGFVLTDASTVIGILDRPWSVDSTGKQLRTHYEWKSGVLSQVLDEDLSRLNYPIVLDPAWGYIQQYNLNFSPATNFSRLQSCFNCYFPVPGAPKAYPAYGQLLPLKVLVIGNFECTMGPTFTGTDYRAFELLATKNHVDGFGSSVTFQFLKVGTQTKLIVDAYVVNDFYYIGQGPYVIMAGMQWQIFANNLNSATART